MKKHLLASAGAALFLTTATASAQSLDGLVNVNIQDVLQDIAIDLNLEENNIPVTIQLPISLAANVCGVDVNVLSAKLGTGDNTCVAETGSQELTQVVQQQMAAGGDATDTTVNVGGSTTGTDTPATGSASTSTTTEPAAGSTPASGSASTDSATTEATGSASTDPATTETSGSASTDAATTDQSGSASADANSTGAGADADVTGSVNSGNGDAGAGAEASATTDANAKGCEKANEKSAACLAQGEKGGKENAPGQLKKTN